MSPKVKQALVHWLKDLRTHVDKQILATPSGDHRNLLTEAAIHLAEAQSKLEEIK